MAIPIVTIETAAESPIMLQSGDPVSDVRMAVVHHVSGLHQATTESHVEEPSIGKIDPERSHMGMKTRFMTLWNEEALWHRHAKASPIADMERQVMASENRASRIPSNPVDSPINGMAASITPA